MEMLSKQNIAEPDLNTVFGRGGLYFGSKQHAKKTLLSRHFCHSPASLPITLLPIIIFD